MASATEMSPPGRGRRHGVPVAARHRVPVKIRACHLGCLSNWAWPIGTEACRVSASAGVPVGGCRPSALVCLSDWMSASALASVGLDVGVGTGAGVGACRQLGMSASALYVCLSDWEAVGLGVSVGTGVPVGLDVGVGTGASVGLGVGVRVGSGVGVGTGV